MSNAEFELEYKAWANNLHRRDELVRETIRTQNDIFAFFNDPEAQLSDVTHWLSLSTWTDEEAVALWLGKEPRLVDEIRVRSFEPEGGSTFHALFMQRLLFLRRAERSGEFVDGMRPRAVMEWATYTASFPAELYGSRTAPDTHETDQLRLQIARLEQELRAERELITSKPKRAKTFYILALSLAEEHYSTNVAWSTMAAVADGGLGA